MNPDEIFKEWWDSLLREHNENSPEVADPKIMARIRALAYAAFMHAWQTSHREEGIINDDNNI